MIYKGKEINSVQDLFHWAKHPILPVPTMEYINEQGWGVDEIVDYYEKRELAIKREADDPYRFGFELPHWKILDRLINEGATEVLLMGGNRSSKTEVCAKQVVRSLVENPNSIIWCFQTTYENSIQMQQKAIYKYLPKELKETQRGKIGYISYTQKRGFSDAKFVLPNGSECIFRNYSQDVSTIEGGEIGCINPTEDQENVHNIGFWADELIPQDFLDTLRFRLVTRNAVGLISFTAIEGYTPVVREFLSGARTLEDKEAELLPGRRVPIIQQPKRSDSKIIYFHTADNPYGGFERIKKTLAGAPKDEILCRAYGVPERPMAGKFPKFSHKYNVVEHDKIPFIKDRTQIVTHYQVIDPAGSKPWFMIWLAVTPLDEIYVWAEYPDSMYGDWADMAKGKKGRPGDAAKPNGNGYQDYIEIMEDIDGDINVFERIIDPRLGATKFQKEEMTTDMINELSLLGIDTVPAPGWDEETGIQAINKWLAWDDRKEMQLGNKPRLFISDRCENLIYAMTEYTGLLGKDEPCKDPIDVLRYAAVCDILYVNEKESNYFANRGR